MTFIAHISSILPVSETLEQELKIIAKPKRVAKGDLILRKDERCDSLFFVTKGLLRGYYYEEDKEITSWFSQEKEFATCFYSFIVQKPSFEFVQALEDSDLLQISYSALQNLYVTFPETERIGRIITENYYIKLEERILNLQFKTAKERYQKLLSSKPTLLLRAPLGHIASYLGISQETLSRIRAEM